MKIIRSTSKNLEKIYSRRFLRPRRIDERVKKIVEDVRIDGDEALLKYTRKFDKVKLSPRQLRVSETDISGAYQNITPHFVSSLKTIIDNINRFYRRTIKKSWKMRGEDG